MNSRFRKLRVESLEGRSVLSTLVQADFNGDGFLDVAEITDPLTITVSLNNGSGGYNVSDVLAAPRNHTFVGLTVQDYEYDGDWDITAVAMKPSGDHYVQYWLNNGDGAFEAVEPFKWKGPRPRWI
jgi:hypothetical protein